MEENLKTLLYEYKRKSMLEFEQICEQLVCKHFSHEECIKIQTLILDEAQKIFELRCK